MVVQPLAGRQVAILVESEYIPEEIEAYRSRFTALGAEVHFMSRLWGQKSLTFVSDVDRPVKDLATTRERLRLMEVDIDFQDVNPSAYAAVIMAAGYTSVRLRFFQPPEGRQVGPELVGTAPAVEFFARAMADPGVVKGALCHGLWILTPRPDLLRGRRVTCHEVVLADVCNAGGIYQDAPDGVVVDGDLVTGHSAADVFTFIEAITGQIVAIGASKETNRAESAQPSSDRSSVQVS